MLLITLVLFLLCWVKMSALRKACCDQNITNSISIVDANLKKCIMFTNSVWSKKILCCIFFLFPLYNVSHLSSPFPVVEWEWWPIAHKCSQVCICDHSLIQQQYHNPLQHCLPDCHSLTPLYLKHHWRSGITYWRQFFILNLIQLNPLAMMDIEPWPLL